MKLPLGRALIVSAFFLIELTATSSTLAQQAASKATSETDLDELTAQWWQCALSIPTLINPLEDTTGANCMIGQSNPVWFLAGFFNGSAATRSCSVPEGAALFFPVINAINFNTPNVCGQVPASISVKDLRAFSAGEPKLRRGYYVRAHHRADGE